MDRKAKFIFTILMIFFLIPPIVDAGLILSSGISYFLKAPFTNFDVGSNSYDFINTSAHYISVANHSDFSQDGFSVCAWIKADSVSLVDSIITKDEPGGREWSFKLYSGELQIQIFDSLLAEYGEVHYNTVIPTGKWFYACGTWDGTAGQTGMDVLLNCASVGDTSSGSHNGEPAPNTSTDVSIGKGYGGDYFDGHITKAAYWSEAISTADCKDAMQNSYSGLAASTKTNLIAWWDLDSDTNDDHATGCGGSGCNGTAQNGVAPASPTDYPSDSWGLVDGQTISDITNMVDIGTVTIVTSNASEVNTDKLNALTTSVWTSDTSNTDFTYQIKVTIPANDTSADCYDLYVRYSDVDNTDKVQICDETAGNDLSYISVDTTVSTTLASADIDWSASTEYTIKIQVTGNNLHKVWVDDVLKIDDSTVEASNTSNTKIGGKTVNDQTFKLRSALVW
jgi:hypothetical protein